MARTVTRDVELHGETLHEGDQVILMYPAANRDPACSTIPTGSTCAAIRTRTSRSGSVRTSAWVRRSLAWSCR